jgi:hypothetical protein
MNRHAVGRVLVQAGYVVGVKLTTKLIEMFVHVQRDSVHATARAQACAFAPSLDFFEALQNGVFTRRVVRETLIGAECGDVD